MCLCCFPVTPNWSDNHHDKYLPRIKNSIEVIPVVNGKLPTMTRSPFFRGPRTTKKQPAAIDQYIVTPCCVLALDSLRSAKVIPHLHLGPVKRDRQNKPSGTKLFQFFKILILNRDVNISTDRSSWCIICEGSQPLGFREGSSNSFRYVFHGSD